MVGSQSAGKMRERLVEIVEASLHFRQSGVHNHRIRNVLDTFVIDLNAAEADRVRQQTRENRWAMKSVRGGAVSISGSRL
jgi:hypothetical protein